MYPNRCPGLRARMLSPNARAPSTSLVCILMSAAQSAWAGLRRKDAAAEESFDLHGMQRVGDSGRLRLDTAMTPHNVEAVASSDDEMAPLRCPFHRDPPTGLLSRPTLSNSKTARSGHPAEAAACRASPCRSVPHVHEVGCRHRSEFERLAGGRTSAAYLDASLRPLVGRSARRVSP
jgi:hypothetical protein